MGKQKINTKIKLKDLFVLNFQTNNEKIASLTKKQDNFTIEIRIGHRFIVEEASALIDVQAIVFLDPKKRSEVCNLSTRSIFEILNFDNYPKNKDGNPFYIVDFVAHLIELGYSTTRGILFGKLSGTIIDNVKLPLIDAKHFANLISNDMKKATKKGERKKKISRAK